VKRFLLAAAVLLPLIGCSSNRNRSDIETVEDTPEYRACLAEARRSPEVMALYRESNPMNEYNAERMGRERTATVNRAYRACLVQRGLALPGGVQAQVPR
jgi:hypothetical protein